MRIKLIIAWYDFWIGLFFDRQKKRLYIFPLPCIGVCFDWDDRFYGTVHYRTKTDLNPFCGSITIGDPKKVTCKDCLDLLNGDLRGIDVLRGA